MTMSQALANGNQAVGACPPVAPRWLRPVAQWLVVAVIHAALIGLALQMSPQVREVLGGVIQAGLIAPQALPTSSQPEQLSRPPEPTPKARPRARSSPLLAAKPRSVSSFASSPAFPSASSADEKTSDEKSSSDGGESSPAGASSGGGASGAAQFVPPAFNAGYLENPPPRYPPASRLHGEKGLVVLRVFVSAAGRAERVEIKTSSGFERLDSVAQDAVANWRFVPARRGDEHVAAWVLVPVSFVMKASS